MTAPEMVPALGSIRRVQALGVAGWPLARLARETGRSPAQLARMMTAATVPVSLARTIAAFYRLYSMASPGLCGVPAMHARAARAHATAKGWAPHWAWDDDTIDDPAAIPQWTGYCGTARGVGIHARDGIPLCPPCTAALERRRLRQQAHGLRALPTTRA